LRLPVTGLDLKAPIQGFAYRFNHRVGNFTAGVELLIGSVVTSSSIFFFHFEIFKAFFAEI
jgi:hypothetical protein